jgi:hypothetical protein
MRSILIIAVVVASAVPGRAADIAKIDEAVKKGVEFLRGFHGSGINPGTHGAGSVALCGMALMAGGMKDTDPTISAIANWLRPQVFLNSKTYDVALMTLFFDKLGKPDDEGLIQLLGVKLVSGQNGAGGWGYDTWNAGSLDAPKWVAAFRAWKPDGRMHPEVAKLYAATRLAGRAGGNVNFHGDDNSNSQFAVIAIWVAGRHGVPIRETASLIDQRYIRSQDPASGGWGYSGFGNATPSMTCAGLLGLAVGFGSREAKLESEAKPDKKKDEDDDPFTKPPAPGATGGEKKEEDADKPTDPWQNRRKAAIDRGLAGLGRILAGNAGQIGGAANGHYGGADDLYFYWSIERVGVAYGIEKIGGVDWYEWGAPALLKSQAADGSWPGAYGAEINTAFGVLFLTRANFAVDLSAKLKGKFGSELRGGGIPIMKAIPFAEQELPKAKPGDPPPKISGIRELSQADKLADDLVGTTGEKEFAEKLKEYQAAKGEQYTVALAFAVTQFEKDRKKAGREALVNRLVRMTPETLRKFIAVNNPELRRATCLACATKDDKVHVADLAGRVVDTDEEVVKAARAGLRSLTGEDYGPTPGANDDEKQAVLSKWRFWIQTKGK